jgi:dolichol-phosphate mannosyltransferase
MRKLNRVTVLAPLYNEREILPSLLERLENVVNNATIRIDVVLVDDGSMDGSDRVLENFCSGKKNFSFISLSRNFGHAAAISAGLHEVDAESEAVFIIDGDLQDPPELLQQFVSKMEEGYDVVYGIRQHRKEGFLKKAAYKTYYRLLKRFSNVEMPLDAGDFALVSARVIRIMNEMPEESRYLRGMRSWVGFKQTGIQYNRESRKNGHSKYSWRALFKLAFNGLFNFSEFPIRFIGYVGLITILVSLGYLGVTLYKKLVFGTVPEGFTALIFAIVLFAGVQLLALGIIGEYVLRIFFQVKKRPLYIVRSRILKGEQKNG